MSLPLRSPLIALAAVLIVLGSACTCAARSDLRLWYRQPAAKWDEALPIGSGRLGAMVFGGTGEDRLQFNEDTLWTGGPHDYVRAGAKAHLDEIRKLVFDGAIDRAEQTVRKTFLSDPVRQKAYQPLGDLRFTFPGHEAATDYRRSLDLDSAVAAVTYRVGDVTFTREALASYPDDVIAIRFKAGSPGKLTFTVRMDSPHKDSSVSEVGRDTLVLSGRVRDTVPPNDPGMRFESRLRVIPIGGALSAGDGAITVHDADEATLLLVAATSFVNFEDVSADPTGRCAAYMAKLEGKSFDVLRAAHLKDYQALFGRVNLDLGRSERANLPTDERLKAVRAASNPTATTAKSAPVPTTLPAGGLPSDPALAALFFQYGRYLLIASSRPHTQPANLQGVWNEQLNPPWESKYTTNINLEMNYWPSEVTNLPECAGPLFDMIDDLRRSGARTAREQYGARGWVLHHNTDEWRGTAPINNVDGAWPTGGAWLCYHLWEHYLFSGDTGFLAKRAYPAMKEASLFFVDALVTDPGSGFLVTNPSMSPEQGRLCAGPAMDMQLVRALFDATTEAARVLRADDDLIKQLADVRARLAPDRVGRYGQLQEWQEDVDKPNNNHRHMSPLWGLYPGAQFTPSDPKLFDAAKVLLGWRGDGSTGWSYAWRIPLHARVADAGFAYRQLALQLGRRTLPNLLDLCGPFQIDGNFGATAGIAEMLLQSHVRPTSDKGVFLVDLLPALPAAWPAGSVSGLRARGGFDVAITWNDARLSRVTLLSRLGRSCKVRYGQHTVDLQTRVGQTYVLDGELRPAGLDERHVEGLMPSDQMKDAPIVIEGQEQRRVDPKLPDGGLPPALGVQSFQVFRASKAVPELADGRGWTYHHHVDMARWNGRLYVGWDSCERDEDVWPSRELYSTSVDGSAWSAPTELFPQGLSTPLRMYFFHADNGRMLAIAGLRTGTADTNEDTKSGLVVREIRPNHTLGEVFVLQNAAGGPKLPRYEEAKDEAFVLACRQLLADRVFLEQQDGGRLLGPRRMKWHNPAAWPGGKVPGDSDKWVAGKAYSFFRRGDGTLVGISKMGWVTTSADHGENWSRPGVPPTLVTGKAKVWSQRTADGRYALVYNPSTQNRFPLVVVTGNDGVHFRDMRLVQGELPVQRYSGLHRSLGPQYVRGISHWADDGSVRENALWVAYSMNKEDIWVSRIPLPVEADEEGAVRDEPGSAAPGPFVPGWNTYCPKWAEVAVLDSGHRNPERSLLLRDRDPYDYARATRVFRSSARITTTFEVEAKQVGRGRLEIELLSKWGANRPVRFALTEDGSVAAQDGQKQVSAGRYDADQWLSCIIEADAARGRFSLTINDRPVVRDAEFAEPADDLERISFRTGPFRGIGGSKPVPAGSDLPTEPADYLVRHVTVSSAREVTR